jgi:hypothetical protein
MANTVIKFEDEVIDVSMNWAPALKAGDSLALVLGEPNVTLTIDGSDVPVAEIISTEENVTRIRLGPETETGAGRLSLLATTVNGEKLGETIYVTVKAR